MIQYRKIPPSKSVLLLLLFLTTNIHGFLRDNQDESRESRRNQYRFNAMDVRQDSTQNAPIRKINIDRIINEKDGNSDRVYDRRSFRTGTIGNAANARSREVIRDVNNNRERSYERDNERSFEPTLLRQRQQRLGEDRRLVERTVMSRNRQSELGRRTNLNNRQGAEFNDGRILETQRSTRSVPSRERSDRTDSRRNYDYQRRLSVDEQKQRSIPSRENSVRRRSVGDGDRRVSEIRSINRFTQNRKLDQRRSSNERLDKNPAVSSSARRMSERRDRFERANTRETFQKRTVDQRRSSAEERNVNEIRSSSERLERNSRDSDVDRRTAHQLDRSISAIVRENRQSSADNSGRSFNRRTVAQRRFSTERLTTNKRIVENRVRSLDQRSTDERTVKDERFRSVSNRQAHDRRISDTFDQRNTEEIRSARDARRISRDQRSRYVDQRNNQRFSEAPSTSVLRRTISLERREAPTAPNTYRVSTRNVQEVSRSDSTRYIQDNTQFKYNRLGPKLHARDNIRSKTESRYVEKLVSQRSTDSASGNDGIPALSFEKNIDTHTYTWASTAKVILAAFLIAQIFLNSSKTSKFRFHNIMPLTAPIKEKAQ